MACALIAAGCDTAPPTSRGGLPERDAYEARGAPPRAVAWDGPWRATVAEVGVPATDPVLATVAGTLSATIVDARTPIVQGELRVVLSAAATPPDTRALPPGEIVVILTGATDPGAVDDAVTRLARDVAGIVDAVGEASRWVTRSEAGRHPRATGMAAAHVIAQAYGITPPTAEPDAPKDRGAWADTPDLLRVALGGARPVDARSPDARIRAEAARTDATAARALADDPDPAVRIAAAATLVADAPTPGDDAPRALLDRLASDPEPLVRARVAQAGDSLARLERLLEDPSSVVRVVAAHTLAAQGAQAPLLRAAAHPDNYVRWKAAWGLRDTATLTRLLADADCDVRREAARSLGRSRDAAARGALEGALRDPNSFVRRWAAEALGELGTPASVPALRVAADDPTALVATAARTALARLEGDKHPRKVTPPAPPRDDGALRSMLASTDATLRKDAAKFAASRDGAQDLLRPLLSDPDSEVRKSAAEALGRVLASRSGTAADATAWGALTAALDDIDPDTRITALDALRTARHVPRTAWDRVATRTRDADAETRLRAYEALAADPGVPLALLDAGAADADERVRAAVAERLGGHAPNEPSVLVRRAANVADTTSTHPLEAHDASSTGFLAREDDLLHMVFSWNRPGDRPRSHRALRPPVLRAYGHPDRG